MGTNTANGKGNVTAYVGYRNSEPVLESQRDFSACSTGFASAAPGSQLVCSGSSNYDRFYSLNNSAASSSHKLTTGVIDNFVKGNGTPGAGTFVPYTAATSQKFNYGALNYLQRPDTRWTGGFFGHYEVNKELDIYTSFMFTDDDSVSQVAPSGLFLGTGSISGTFDNINCSNPLLSPQEKQSPVRRYHRRYLCHQCAICRRRLLGRPGHGNCATTFGIAGCQAGQATLEIGRRNVEGGDRDAEVRHISYRAQVGAKGDLGNGWSYNVYAQYGETTFVNNALGFYSVRQSAAAMQVEYGPGGTPQCITGAPKCIPVDFYSGIGGLTPAMEDSIYAVAETEGYTREGVISGSITGDFGEWGGKSPWAKNPIAVAIGGEYREEYLNFLTDTEVSSDDLQGAGGADPSVPTSGFNVTEGFGEVADPDHRGAAGIRKPVGKGRLSIFFV